MVNTLDECIAASRQRLRIQVLGPASGALRYLTNSKAPHHCEALQMLLQLIFFCCAEENQHENHDEHGCYPEYTMTCNQQELNVCEHRD